MRKLSVSNYIYNVDISLYSFILHKAIMDNKPLYVVPIYINIVLFSDIVGFLFD